MGARTPPATAFRATAAALHAACAGAELDAASFARPLRRCALARCGGTCCAEGVTLNPEEALVVRQLTRKHGERLRAFVPDLPEPAVVDEEGVTRTARKPRPFRALVPDYPEHFPETACAFLGPDARCALQRLAEAEGEHPWTYKPLACWLHPIAVSPERVWLPDPASDPNPGGFASQTHCGRVAADGPPAHEVLAAELEWLGGLLERDLAAELRARGP